VRAQLYRAFDGEMKQGYTLLIEGNLDASQTHFERAHILGQRYVLTHAQSHWCYGARPMAPAVAINLAQKLEPRAPLG